MAMKRLLALFLVIVMALGCFASCKKDEDPPEILPTDEELITETIETFLTAYNTGDMDAVLQCLDAKTRNAFQAMLNLLGGLAGSAAGFDIDLKDLFSLGVSTTQGDFMGLEITNINVIDSSNAVATTTMNLTGAGVQTIYFEMVYENDGWYIHDMTDRKPNGANSTQDNTNNGDSSDTGDIGSGDVLNSGYKITACEPFLDDRAWLQYYECKENEGIYNYYYGFIDTQGNVLYSLVDNELTEYYNIGKGAGLIKSSSEIILVDRNGDVGIRLNGDVDVKAVGGGYALLYQNKSTITTIEHLYGVVNYDGDWVMSLTNLNANDVWDNMVHIGDGMFAPQYRNDLTYQIYDAETKNTISISNMYTDCDLEFENGISYVSMEKIKYAKSAIIASDAHAEMIETTSDFILHKDGSITEIPTPLWYSSGKAVVQNGEYLKIIDCTKANFVEVEFTKYPASMIEDIIFEGDYGLIQIRGLDEKVYVSMIDTQGQELCDPIEGKYIDDCSLTPSGYIIYYSGENYIYKVIDKTGIVRDITIPGSVAFNGNIGAAQIGDWYNYEYYYINPTGEKLFDNLKVN